MSTLFGIIGYPLGHTFSPAYFNNKFAIKKIDAEYKSFPIADIHDFISLLKENPSIRGLSVTIPYKEAIIAFLDQLDGVAEKVGAVNCISIKNGVRKGYNTDIIGFRDSLLPLLKNSHRSALILGTGGASRAVAYVLDELGIAYKFVTRKQQALGQGGLLCYEQLTIDDIDRHKLIINTTPLGMYPNESVCADIPYDGIGNEHLLYDLIYNPEETKFMMLGKLSGAVTKNGLEMLHLQAEAAWDIWNS